jgi:arylformamidase
MTFIDVTRPLSPDLPVYPGDTRFAFTQEDRGQYRISDIHMSTHTGTHIDAPSHYLKSGDTIDTVPLSHLVGRCRILDVSGAGSTIGADHLRGRIGGVERLLLKTSFSGADRFSEDHPHLTHESARFIISCGIQCVGIDSPSIESHNSDGTVHRELLGHGCIIIELLDLSAVGGGDYDMVALPLRLAGLDGSPARVILFSRKK